MMADQEKDEGRPGESGAAGGATGDPGRTPGKAEGDERTVEEDLRQKKGGGQK